MGKNNKGFTLVELLAVIVVLAIVASIVVTSAFSLVKSSRNDEYQVLISEVGQAVKLYLNDNYENYVISNNANSLTIKMLSDSSCAKSYIKLKALVDNNYLKQSALVDPRNNNRQIDIEKYVEVKYEDSSLIISNEFVDSPAYTCNGMTFSESYGYYDVTNVNNYVTFNNQLFRVIRINKDGSIRMILDSDIGSSVFGGNGVYQSSYVLPNIQYWYIYDVSKYAKELVREASISLVTKDEYNSFIDSMKTDDEIWLLDDNSGITNKSVSVDYATLSAKIKPVLEIKPGAIYVTGDGTINNSYKIR